MSEPITMPTLSDTMNSGTLVKWVMKLGDPIKKGDTIAEVETDKAVMEVTAFHDGYLAGPLASEGAEMPVGQIIGYIADSPGEAATAAANILPSPPRLRHRKPHLRQMCRRRSGSGAEGRRARGGQGCAGSSRQTSGSSDPNDRSLKSRHRHPLPAGRRSRNEACTTPSIHLSPTRRRNTQRSATRPEFVASTHGGETCAGGAG